jgi:predicted Zn-dependent protease with MMP-like domain
MPTSANPQSFEPIVQWAYSTLPQKIKDLPDFPGIQVVAEPPPDVLKDVAEQRRWPKGTEMLGLYSGRNRTERQHFQPRIAPDLIFVFRGPILRCSKGDLRSEVKRVVWTWIWLGDKVELTSWNHRSSSGRDKQSVGSMSDMAIFHHLRSIRAHLDAIFRFEIFP